MPIHSKANIMPILSVQTVCVGEVKWQSLVRQAKDKEEEGEKEEEEKEKKKKQGPFFYFAVKWSNCIVRVMGTLVMMLEPTKKRRPDYCNHLSSNRHTAS